MYGSGTVIKTEDIYSLISRCESNLYNVFIQPNGIVDPEKAIDEMKLDCEVGDLMIENLLHETFDDSEEANKRVMMFRGKWLNHFYVSCYLNGEFQNENT